MLVPGPTRSTKSARLAQGSIWPARLPAGQRREELVCLTDLFGIATTAAGAPDLRQGSDVLGMLEGRAPARERVVGISKLARVLHGFARRLQVQERLTAEVANCIWDNLKPHGVAVVIEAQHGCMTGRGVRTPGVGMVTSKLLGCFLEDNRSRKEVLSLMGY